MLSVLKPYGIPRAKAYYLNQGEPFSTREIIKTVGLPCFVKANRSGSSIGVFKAYDEKDIDQAIEKAFEVDTEVIIEEFLKGTEVSVGVITYHGKNECCPSLRLYPKMISSTMKRNTRVKAKKSPLLA